MIIKKPYAFFIKHFKIIHLLLIVPILYLAFKFGDIAHFFRDYVSSNYQTTEVSIAGNYITVLMYAAIIFLIIVNSIIYLLMHNKKKSTIYYGISIVFYIILLVLTLLFYSAMSSIELGTISETFTSFIKDFAGIATIPCYLLVVVTFVKGIGFNIKTLRFDNYLGLQITEDDNEEIEIKLKSDKNTLKKGFVHYIRELKYYVLENKFVFTCLGLAIIVGILISVYMNLQVYNKNYNLHEAFALDKFNMTLKESYITDVDYSGNVIEEGYYYLAVKIGITNKSKVDSSIDKSNFRIFIGNDVLFPKYDRSSRFVDIGNSYQGNTIRAGTSDDYVFVYELDKNMVKSQYKMKILSDLKQSGNKLNPSYKNITIKPIDITKNERIANSKIGEEIPLTKTNLGNTIYTLKSFEITKSYQYSYQVCKTSTSCVVYKDVVLPSSGKALLVLKDDIQWDESTSYYKNTYRKIYDDFGVIAYYYNNKEYQTRLKELTPSNLKDIKVIEIPDLLTRTELDNMKLFFKIRNKIISIAVT